ncbi:MAG: sulfur carrier protein ThiS [Pseudomonadota bacterium]
MKIIVNGSEESCPEGTLGEYVRRQGLIGQRMVVEHNRVVVPAERWDKLTLAEGDQLELLSFVGGG